MPDISADVSAASRAGSTHPASATGLHFDRFFTPDGSQAYEMVEWERRTAAITNAAGKVFFEQKDVEVPRSWSQLASNIVAQKYFWGRLGDRRAGDQRAAAGGPRRGRALRLGPGGWLLRHRAGCGELGSGSSLAAGHAARVVQQPGVVQHRHPGPGAAGVGLLHQLGPGHDGVDSRPGQDRGDAVQVRLGNRNQPLRAALLQRGAGGWRHRLRPGLVHAWLRQLRGLHQVRWHHTARGQDGDPERRPPGHPGLRPLQGGGGEEGLGADRGRLRRRVQRARRRL